MFAIRFGEKPRSRGKLFRVNRYLAGHDDQLYGGPSVSNVMSQFNSIHRSWHFCICEYQVRDDWISERVFTFRNVLRMSQRIDAVRLSSFRQLPLADRIALAQ
jgi:hypothetical protein